MITPTQEAMITLLIYCGFATLAGVVWLMLWYYQTKKKQLERKDHLIEMWILRVNELSLLIEEAWQTTKKQ